MWRLLLFVVAVTATAATISLDDRDDIIALTSVNEQFAEAGVEKLFENLFSLVHTVARRESEFTADAFAHLLTPNVRYVYHGRGVCEGITQVIGCLVAEQENAEEERRSAGTVEYQLSEVIQGGAQAIRLLEIRHPRTLDGRTVGEPERRLDVFFIHVRHSMETGETHAWLIEHIPTVVQPNRLHV